MGSPSGSGGPGRCLGLARRRPKFAWTSAPPCRDPVGCWFGRQHRRRHPHRDPFNGIRKGWQAATSVCEVLEASSGRTANTPGSCSILPRHSPRIWLLSPPPAHVAGRPRPLGHGKDAACTEASTGPSSEPPWIGGLIWGRESGLKKCQAPGPPLCWAPRKRAQGKLRGYLWEAQPNNSNLPIPKHANQRWTTLAIRTSTYNPCSAQLADDDRDAPT